MLQDSIVTLKGRMRIRLHIGTAEAIGRITVLDKDEIGPGGEAFIQFRSETPIVAARGDRFVIRSYSPMRVVGGGLVLEPNAVRHRRFDPKGVQALEAKRQGDPGELIEQALLTSAVMSPADLARSVSVPDAEITVTLERLTGDGRVTRLDASRLMHSVTYSTFSERVAGTLSAFHSANPLKVGQGKEELRAAIGKNLDQKSFSALLVSLESEGKIRIIDNAVRLSGYEIKLSAEQEQAARRLESTYLEARFNPPLIDEALASAGGPKDREILDLLVSRGALVKVEEGLCFHKDALAEAEQLIRKTITENGPMAVSTFRDLTGSSRKYVVPLLEYFDSKRVTRRAGDARVLVK